MNLNAIAIIIPLPVSLVCLFLSIRAFYVYILSRSGMIIIIALAMGSIALSLFIGVMGDEHLIPFNTGWVRYLGSSYGILFIFLCSLMRSHEQTQQLRRWQMISAIVFIALILFMPILPFFTTPVEPAILNGIRMVITGCAFFRYTFLYATKGTRFSMIMDIGFLLLIIGFTMNMLYIFAPLTFIVLYILGAFVVMAGYSTLLAAYSLG